MVRSKPVAHTHERRPSPAEDSSPSIGAGHDPPPSPSGPGGAVPGEHLGHRDPILEKLLDPLDRLAEKATPGPWERDSDESTFDVGLTFHLLEYGSHEPDDCYGGSLENEEYITALRNRHALMARALRAALALCAAERTDMGDIIMERRRDLAAIRAELESETE